MRRLLLSAFLAALGAVSTAWSQAAYRVGPDGSINVDRASHWAGWEFQNDMVSRLVVPVAGSGLFGISAAGMQPRYFRDRVNVAPDAEVTSYLDEVRAGAPGWRRSA